MGKARFQFYETFENIIDLLPMEEQFRFYKALVRYGLFGEDAGFTENKDKAIFQPIKEALDDQFSRKTVLSENGKKGGAPQGNKNALKTTQNNPKQPKSSKNNQNNQNTEYEYEYEKEFELIDCGGTPPRHSATKKEPIPPLPEAIHEFYLSEKLKVLPYEFYLYNARNNWTDNDGYEIENWRGAYLAMDAASVDKGLTHNPALVFNRLNYLQ